MIRIQVSIVSVLLYLGTALAGTPLQNLQVTLRGKKYDISDVTSLKDLKDKVKEASGNTKDHHVLFDGKRLSAAVDLSEAGVADGAQLNMVPALSKKKTPSKTASKTTSAEEGMPDGVRTTTTTESTADTENAMKEYLKKSGIDGDQLDELMKSMGGGAGGAGADGKMPDMNESLEMMANMMNNPMFQEYMNNPEMLEQSRQMILNNPMLKNMMAGMPGMAEILENPVAWREAMQAAVSMYKNMDPDQLKNMMNGMGGMGGMGGAGVPPGLFDGTTGGPPAQPSALDELDED